MRIPVWAHDASPDIDPPLCRKSLSYCEDSILRNVLRPIDVDDIRKGCIAMCWVNLRGDSAEASLKRVAGGGFASAWQMKQSGWAGPLVWQLRTR